MKKHHIDYVACYSVTAVKLWKRAIAVMVLIAPKTI